MASGPDGLEPSSVTPECRDQQMELLGGKGPAPALVEQIALEHLEQNSRPVAQPNPETHSDRVDSNRSRNGSMLVRGTKQQSYGKHPSIVENICRLFL